MKTNRLFGWIVALAMIYSINVTAQQVEKKSCTPEDRLAHRIERMKKELMLDEVTAGKFETCYKNYTNELKACFPDKEMKQPIKEEIKKPLSDQELDKMMTQRLDNQVKMAQIKKKYYAEFKKFLNVKQVAKLYSSERKSSMIKEKDRTPQMERKEKVKPCCGEKTVCDDGQKRKRRDRSELIN